MKTFRVVAIMTVLALFSSDTFAWGDNGGWFKQWRHRKHQKTIRQQDTNPTNAVGAPLDGGLLVLLGAAGVAYYGVRRKKNTAEVK